jgi:outer membrane protein/adhesin transport system outer membrane protein
MPGGRRPGRGVRGWLAGAAAAGVWALALPASAQTLQEALAIAYETSPAIASAYEDLSSLNELVPQALANSRPTVVATGRVGAEYLDADPGESDTLNPASVGVTVNQPIYTFGRTDAALSQAEYVIQAGRASLYGVEQQTLLAAATAYMNVVEAQAVLELQINNEERLQRQLQATRDRFEVGEVTRTDVSQAESALAGATAARIEAVGNLRTARAVYQRVVGVAPVALEAPPPLEGLPVSLEEAVGLAESDSPDVIAAEFNERSAQAAVEAARAELLPEISLTGEVRRDEEPSQFTDRANAASVVAEIRVPLYQAGLVSSQVREARYEAARLRIEVEDARREAVEEAISAWEELSAARASLESRQAQVVAAQVALEGITQEAQVGARTVLDVLDSEQDLLDAQVDLVEAQRDEVVAAFRLMASVGRLTAAALGLAVDLYDIDEAYNQTRNRIWGTSIVGE